MRNVYAPHWSATIPFARSGGLRLDNDGVHSSERILPEYQDLAAGDMMPLTPGPDAEVRVLEPNRYLLLIFAPATDPATGEAPDNFWTWSWGLYETASGHTRLATRLHVRARLHRTLFLDLFEIVMMRKCLLGIKRRTETEIPAET